MNEANPPAAPLPNQNLALNDVLTSIEGDYFIEYALFTGSMREYTVRGLEETFKAEEKPSELHRRMFMLAIYREQFMAYEDLGAFVDGLLTKATDSSISPLTRIMTYIPGEVRLVGLFEKYDIKTGDDLFNRLNLKNWTPNGWSDAFPAVDLHKVLRRACAFFAADCAATQKKPAVDAFNKLKHGLLFVSNGKQFNPKYHDAPGILIRSPKTNPGAVENPVTVYQLPVTDELIETRLQAIHFTQSNLRLLAALYVINLRPQSLVSRGLPGLKILGHPSMADVMDIAQQSSTVPWDPENGPVLVNE